MEYNELLINAVNQTEEEIISLLKGKDRVLIAVDGRSASGKTTFAKLLKERLDSTLFHIDDFYLPREMQTEERLSRSGGNIDRNRFLNEVLLPSLKGEKITYIPFDCKTQDYKDGYEINPAKIVIAEGSYSCHNEFFDLYDLHIFLTISPETQKERIIKRNGEEGYKIFKDKWIPFEERYFNEQDIENKCRLVFVNE